MKKILALAALFSFLSFSAVLAVHIHADVESHADCGICLAAAAVSAALPDTVLYTLQFSFLFVVFFFRSAASLDPLIYFSSRSPPVSA